MDTATLSPLIQQPDLTATLAWRTVNNQLVLPEALLDALPGVKLFAAALEDGRIVLTPLPTSEAGAAAARDQLAAQGLTESDVKDAIAWARGQ